MARYNLVDRGRSEQKNGKVEQELLQNRWRMNVNIFMEPLMSYWTFGNQRLLYRLVDRYNFEVETSFIGLISYLKNMKAIITPFSSTKYEHLHSRRGVSNCIWLSGNEITMTRQILINISISKLNRNRLLAGWQEGPPPVFRSNCVLTPLSSTIYNSR